MNDPRTEPYEYDAALSFAGEDREFVHEVAEILKAARIRVFYDDFEKARLVGKNLYEHLYSVYAEQARFCVVFISGFYVKKNWTNHEFRSAQSRAFEQRSEYILPVRLDSTETLPGMPRTIGWLDAQSLLPYQVAKLLIEKLDLARIPQTEHNLEAHNMTNLFFLCGLPSSGKDSLLAAAYSRYLRNQIVFFLTKVTSRAKRSNEAEDRPCPYFVETVSKDDLIKSSKYFGVFTKYGNWYGFSKAQFKNWLLSSAPSWIVAIYSATENLEEFRREVQTLVLDLKTGWSEAHRSPTFGVQVHWILIDVPMDDCLDRNQRRNIDRSALERKSLEITHDKNLIQALKLSHFFDHVIDNSNDRPFNEVVAELTHIFQDLAHTSGRSESSSPRQRATRKKR